MPKGRALGRGLDALIPLPERESSQGGRTVAVEALRPNPRQPRRRWDGQALEELATSIGRHGILEPIVVRDSGQGFEIISGERRWRAAMKAGLKEVPVVVREAEDRDLLEMALAENLQRQDLSAYEQAEAFRDLQSEFEWTQEELARQVGKSRSHVANVLRVLTLPAGARDLAMDGKLSLGHVKALLECDDPARLVSLARRVVDEDLSVRETARLVAGGKGRTGEPPGRAPSRMEAWSELAAMAEARWGSRLRMSPARGGRVRVEVAVSEGDVGRLLRLLSGDASGTLNDEIDVPRGTSNRSVDPWNP